MSLTLTTLRCPETIPLQTWRVSGHVLTIGRGLDNDWVLPDPNRHLSKHHCTLSFREGAWQVADSSTNGTYINRDDQPVGHDRPRALQDGDRLRLGMYEIELRIAVEQPRDPSSGQDVGGPAAEDHTRMFRPLTDDPPQSAVLPRELAGDLVDPVDDTGGPFAEPGSHAAPPPLEIPEDWNLDPFDEALPAPPVPPPAVAAPDLFAAFMRGAGIRQPAPEDAEATMEALGAAFRATVSGIRQVLLARASIKSEFRIEQTLIRARGNNPLKFSAGDDAALASMIGLGRRTDMPAAEAVRDALRDMQLHELASMAAMQAAVRALVAQFDPEKIRASADQGGMALVAVQRKARAWDAFEAQHARVTGALADDFDSVFGKAFAIAYEQTLQEASARTETV